MLGELEKTAIINLRKQGWSYSKIADSMNLSINTVKSFLTRIDEEDGIYKTDLCLVCNKKLKNKKQRFCSDHCRYTWWNSVRTKQPYKLTCECCSKEFVSYGNPKKKYCSLDCLRASRNKN